MRIKMAHTVYLIMCDAEVIYVGCTSKTPEERLSCLKSSFKGHDGPFLVSVVGCFVSAEEASIFEQNMYQKHRPYYNGKGHTATYPISDKPMTDSYLWRFPTRTLRTRLRAEAKARKWSLQTYLNHLVATHHERVRPTNPEEGA